MKIVLAFDSFKGSLGAAEACRIAADALAEIKPDAELIPIPLADGGEGTAAALLTAQPGEWISVPATGPLPSMCVDAGFAWFPFDKTAVVETASASGLTLLRTDQRNPMLTSTMGTGELIRAAAEYGAQRILLAAGGSATVDGGMGAAHALGWRFIDAKGAALAPRGAALSQIARMVPPQPRPALPPIEVLADVRNPLLGAHGAARVFGPQKGASPDQVEKLELGLLHLAGAIQSELMLELGDVSGGGAAGGLAAGAMAFFGARILSGIDVVMRETNFDTALAGADWVLTGEGRFDATSLAGKVVSGVAVQARQAGVKVAVLAGRIDLGHARWSAAGIAYAAALATPTISDDDALRLAPALLRDQVLLFAREWL